MFKIHLTKSVQGKKYEGWVKSLSSEHLVSFAEGETFSSSEATAFVDNIPPQLQDDGYIQVLRMQHI